MGTGDTGTRPRTIKYHTSRPSRLLAKLETETLSPNVKCYIPTADHVPIIYYDVSVTLYDGAALPDQGPLPRLPVGRRHGPLLLLDQVLLVLRQHQAVLNLTM